MQNVEGTKPHSYPHHLRSYNENGNLRFKLDPRGVLVLQPIGPLTREDFLRLAQIVDPWIESHFKLQGVVFLISHFPGWENFAAFVEHIEFVHDHHKKVRRVALCTDAALPELIGKIASHFVSAELRTFHCNEMKKALAWARYSELT